MNTNANSYKLFILIKRSPNETSLKFCRIPKFHLTAVVKQRLSNFFSRVKAQLLERYNVSPGFYDDYFFTYARNYNFYHLHIGLVILLGGVDQ